MVFQSYAVWPHMTVRQNVAYPLRHRGTPRAEMRRARSTRRSNWSGCRDYAKRPVMSLSGGQMQRVALARSLVYQPQLLLLDEPLSNLDAKLRLRLRDDLRRIIKQTGVTALYVTHDQAEAVVLGDRIGVMRDGKLLQMATADEIYNRPADLFVANFTGASNLLAGRVVGARRRVRQVEAGVAANGCGVSAGERAAGEAVKIAVRPRTSGSAPTARPSPTRFTAQVAAHAIRARRPSTSSTCWAAGSMRSSSAPLRAMRWAARSAWCCRRSCAGPIPRARASRGDGEGLATGRWHSVARVLVSVRSLHAHRFCR